MCHTVLHPTTESAEGVIRPGTGVAHFVANHCMADSLMAGEAFQLRELQRPMPSTRCPFGFTILLVIQQSQAATMDNRAALSLL